MQNQLNNNGSYFRMDPETVIKWSIRTAEIMSLIEFINNILNENPNINVPWNLKGSDVQSEKHRRANDSFEMIGSRGFGLEGKLVYLDRVSSGPCGIDKSWN